MFQDKDPIFGQNISRQEKIGKFCQSGMIVGRICKYDIERLVWFFQVTEGISPNYGHQVQFQLPAGLLNEFEMGRDHLHCYYRSYTPGSKLICDAASPCKQVQNIQSLKIELMNQNIKKALFGKIGGGSGLEILWWMDLFAPVCATDYAHLLPSDRIIK